MVSCPSSLSHWLYMIGLPFYIFRFDEIMNILCYSCALPSNFVFIYLFISSSFLIRLATSFEEWFIQKMFPFGGKKINKKERKKMYLMFTFFSRTHFQIRKHNQYSYQINIYVYIYIYIYIYIWDFIASIYIQFFFFVNYCNTSIAMVPTIFFQ